MRVEKAQVQNFQCVRDSGIVDIEESVTTFIGKNESGKTSFLKALDFFNRGSTLEEEDLCNFSGETAGKALPVVTLWLRVLADDSKEVAIVSDGDALEITKASDKSLSIASDIPWGKVTEWRGPYGFIKMEDGTEVHVHYSDIVKESGWGSWKSLSEGDQAFFRLETPSATSSVRTPHVAKHVVAGAPDKVGARVAELVLKRVPRFVYLTGVPTMEDRVSKEAFLSDPSQHEALASLLTLAGVSVDQLRAARTLPARTRLGDQISRDLTGKIKPYWSQSENLTLRVRVEESDIGIIIDDHLGSYTPVSRRSQGLQWYLAFLITLLARAPSDLSNAVVLLDDPGIALHPSAQKDMLAMLGQLGASTQVLLATHSPFLLDPGRLSGVRVVAREALSEAGVGTRIRKPSYDRDTDALSPLRAAVGMTLAEALFASRHELMVSGATDFIIIHAMNSALGRLDRRISLFPVSGDSKFSYFAKIFEQGDIDFVILLDGDRSGRQTASVLKKDHGIEASDIILLGKIYDPGRDVEIEDFFSDGFYNQVVNDVYKDRLGCEIPLAALDLGLKQTTRYQRWFGQRRKGRFDKKPVAEAIERAVNKPDFQPDHLGAETLNRFSALFWLVNARFGFSRPESQIVALFEAKATASEDGGA